MLDSCEHVLGVIVALLTCLGLCNPKGDDVKSIGCWARLAFLAKRTVIVVDLLDVVLDFFLVAKVNGEPGGSRYAALLGGCTVLATLIATFGKLFFAYVVAADQKNNGGSVSAEGKRMSVLFFCAFELVVFFIEDSTTIFVFTQVPGAYDPTDWLDVANVYTTTISAVAIVLGTTYAIVTQFWEHSDVYFNPCADHGGKFGGNGGKIHSEANIRLLSRIYWVFLGLPPPFLGFQLYLLWAVVEVENLDAVADPDAPLAQAVLGAYVTALVLGLGLVGGVIAMISRNHDPGSVTVNGDPSFWGSIATIRAGLATTLSTKRLKAEI